MEIIYTFVKEEGTVFETISTEGDGIYWANLNGGVQLNAYDITTILNGGDIEEIIDTIWKKKNHRI